MGLVVTRTTSRQPFALEQAYRSGFAPGLLDLSSSAAWPTTLGDLLGPDACNALRDCSLGYEPGGGSHELRSAVARLYDGLAADNVLITAGALEAIRCVAMALVEPGQRVLVQSPAYGALRQAVVDSGGLAVEWGLGAIGQAGSLAKSSRNACDLAFVNSPHGPSGAFVRGLERIIGRLVVDEVYRPIELVPGTRAPSCVERSETAVAIGDLSKPLGLGGLRIGWIASRDREVIRRCADALDYLSGSVSSLSARVALHALGRFEDLLAPHLATAQENLSTLAAFVERHREVVDWVPPQAGYTACLRLRDGAPPQELFARLRNRGIFLLDGVVFGEPDALRIGLGMPCETFNDALAVLGKELAALGPVADAHVTEGSGPEVVLYTKLPQPGQGKSRLAADIGVAAAAALAGAFFQDSLRMAHRETSQLFVALASADGANRGEEAPRAPSPALPLRGTEIALEACVFPQRGLDMGERLCHAFEDAFARGARKPVLIGSDSPTLPAHLLTVASRALETHDVVLGPAIDGGYYLVGLKAQCPSLFEGIDWSTDRVLAQTRERAQAAGLSVFYLPYWYDVDTVADLQRLRRDAKPGSAVEVALRVVSR